MTDWADLVLHPVRIRVLRALAGTRRTTRELTALLDDVPQASLYRHIAALAHGGVIEIVEENRVRGTVERVYAIAPGATTIPPGRLSQATRADHERYFTAFVSTLLADFDRYLSRGEPDLAADGAGYHTLVMNLSDAELREFAASLTALITPLLANKPGDGRKPRQFTTIVMPGEDERT